jgi:hypothetical protein
VRSGSQQSNPLRFTGTRPWTKQDEVWKEAGARWEVEALPKIRAAADRWAAGLAILLGGSGIGVLLAGPEKLAPLEGCWEAWAKGLLFAAGVLATLALASALRAGGVAIKTLFVISGPALRRASREAFGTAAKLLRFSQWVTVLALALLLGAAAVLFFAPKEPGFSTPGSATTSEARTADSRALPPAP